MSNPRGLGEPAKGTPSLRSRLKRFVPRQVRIVRIQILAAIAPRKRAWLKPPRNDVEMSVITDPLPEGLYWLSQRLRSWLRGARRVLGRRPDLESGNRGHPAVTRSVVQGLQKLAVRSNYNPSDLRELSQTVLVLSNVSALRQMIQLKQQGYVRKLLVGPNVVDDPGSHRGILASPEIDRNLGPTPWRVLLARVLPALERRCAPWKAGVDTTFWTPGPTPRDRVLIYSKQVVGPTPAIEPYREALEAKGYETTMIEYGSYTGNQYRSTLQSSQLMVAFSRSETQGLALAEAWACDVPTFVWDNSEPTYLGVAYGGSTAPYLSERTGKLFANLDEFRNLLDRWERRDLHFEPRAWCCENMSDEVSARELLAIAQAID